MRFCAVIGHRLIACGSPEKRRNILALLQTKKTLGSQNFAINKEAEPLRTR